MLIVLTSVVVNDVHLTEKFEVNLYSPYILLIRIKYKSRNLLFLIRNNC